MVHLISVPFEDGGNPSPSGEVSFCDWVNNPEPPSPLRGEDWDGGDTAGGGDFRSS
jgi:hypothetical protein